MLLLRRIPPQLTHFISLRLRVRECFINLISTRSFTWIAQTKITGRSWTPRDSTTAKHFLYYYLCCLAVETCPMRNLCNVQTVSFTRPLSNLGESVWPVNGSINTTNDAKCSCLVSSNADNDYSFDEVGF